MHRIIAVSALWAVFAAFPLSGHAQSIVPSENRSAIALYLVLDPLQDANTAAFRWVDGRARLVLHPSAGAFGLRSALRHLGRYARNDNPDWRPVDDPVVLPVDRPPHGYEREPAEYWDRLIAATPIEMKGHGVPVRVDSTRFGISKRRYQVPPVPPDTVPASFDDDPSADRPVKRAHGGFPRTTTAAGLRARPAAHRDSREESPRRIADWLPPAASRRAHRGTLDRRRAGPSRR